MNRIVLFAFALECIAIAQPWPLIRLRQINGAAPQLEDPASAPDAGIQVFGFTSITGKPEMWQMETHLSFAGMEEFDRAKQPRTGSAQTLVLVHRPYWSHRPDEAIQALRKARYLQISIYQVALGSESDLSNLLASRRARMDGINLDRPELTYQTIFGASTGTVFVISPLTSLKSLDDGVSRSGAGYSRSTGTPPARGPGAAATGDLLQENALFRLAPALSAVSPEFADSDPGFWRK